MDATLDRFAASTLPRTSWQGARNHPSSWLLVFGAHALLAMLLLQAWTPAPKLAPKRLIPVRWIAPEAPQPKPPEPRREAIRLDAASRLDTQPTAPTPLPTSTATDTPAPAPMAPMAAMPVTAEPHPMEAFVPTPPVPARVTVQAPRYLVEPKLNLPLASRRLGEQGLVQLRLRIGTNGELLEVQLARSSGFERLDSQALRDIRSARFAPLVESGRAVEWEGLALLSYELTR
jgi:protein TonB